MACTAVRMRMSAAFRRASPALVPCSACVGAHLPVAPGHLVLPSNDGSGGGEIGALLRWSRAPPISGVLLIARVASDVINRTAVNPSSRARSRFAMALPARRSLFARACWRGFAISPPARAPCFRDVYVACFPRSNPRRFELPPFNQSALRFNPPPLIPARISSTGTMIRRSY